jgi:hypothetical protein
MIEELKHVALNFNTKILLVLTDLNTGLFKKKYTLLKIDSTSTIEHMTTFHI